jgi:hypothetical protein
LHYNGPAVAGFGNPRAERDQMIFDARYHMRAGALGSPRGGDGLQYHGGTFSDGSNWQFRDWAAKLWHAGNFEANEYGLAWHVPLGGNQTPTRKQRIGVFLAIAAARKVYPKIIIANVRGHKEFKHTLCPGNAFGAIVLDYREGRAEVEQPGAVQWFVTTYRANTREAPSIRAPIALGGMAVWAAGVQFPVDQIIEDGEEFGGSRTWLHRADHVGFVHISAARSL